ncbi:MAG: peptidyl-prolyl cis-trans isomerase [Pyrinomonadaceae bacterium]
MKYIYFTLSLFIVTLFAVPAVSAQEAEERVVDEVVAQVGNGVLTLSRINREANAIVETEVKNGKSREESQKMVDERRGELIANLINEELLIQKAKELNLDSDVEAAVNGRFIQIMKQYGLKTVDELNKTMEQQGVDPAEIREMWRKQAIRDMVIQREVQQKVYWQANAKELRAYFEAHKAKFTKPETVSFSEIFLGFAGRDENAVRTKAKELVTKLRGGADFAKVQQENSDPGVISQGTGKVENLKVAELSDQLTEAIKGLKVGNVTDPIEANNLGIVILRIDGREQASSESHFDESAVRGAILAEKAPEATKDYMATLRKESYIKIGEAYRPLVSPILYADERKEKSETKPEEKKEKVAAKTSDNNEKSNQE